MDSFRLEWQQLSTDLTGKPTFKVVLLGAYKQAEELLYTYHRGKFPKDGVWWSSSDRSDESLGWWTSSYTSRKNPTTRYRISFVLQKTGAEYKGLRAVNYPSNCAVLCYAVDIPETWREIPLHCKEVKDADPFSFKILLALHIDARKEEFVTTPSKQTETPFFSTADGLKLAASLQIPHFAEVSAKTREGFENFFDFIKELADPWGEKKLTSRGELYVVWRSLPPPPPPPRVLCDSTTLWSDLETLLRDAPFSDVRLRVCTDTTPFDQQENTTIPQLLGDDIAAHRIVLASASPICRSLVSGQWSVKSVLSDIILRVDEVEEPAKILIITFRPSITRTILWTLLEFIYTGTAHLSNHTVANQVYSLATTLQMNELAQWCHNFITGIPDANNTPVTSARHSLVQHFRELCTFTSRTSETDLALMAEDKLLYAHKCILTVRSAMMKQRLQTSPAESTIQLGGIGAEALQCALEFCYTGTCPHLTYTNAASVLKTSVLLGTEPLLKQLCEQTIVQGIEGTRYFVTVHTLAEQVINFLHVAEQYHAAQLKEYCCYFLGVNATELSSELFRPLVSNRDWAKRIQRHRWPPANTVLHDGPFFCYSS
jgi:hypothetical protein